MKNSKLLHILLRAYHSPNLSPAKFLLFGGNDAAAVSDGTAQCHLKEAMHLTVLNRIRDDRKMTLGILVMMMEDCEHWGQESYDGPISDAALDKVRYVISELESTTAIIEQMFVRDDRTYLDFIKDCIALRQGDTWVKTAFDKGINVRARKNVPFKLKMERRIQEDVLDWFMSRLSSKGGGYGRQLVSAMESQEVFRQGVGVMDFTAATLATFHTSFQDADWTRFQIVRTVVSGSGPHRTMELRQAYSLHFRHNRLNGRLEYLQDPGLHGLFACGLSYVMESKVQAGQQGQGLCAEDDEEWLSFVTTHPTALLLIYAFSHPAFPTVLTKTDHRVNTVASKQSSNDVQDRPLPAEAAALSLLDGFDLRGPATNPDLHVLAAAAKVFGHRFGLGASKYIDTIRDGVAYHEPDESVALNIHHIYAGTGADADRRMHLCNERMQSHVKLPMALLVAGSHAVPCSSERYLKKILEADDEHFSIKSDSIIAETGVDISIFPQEERLLS